MTGIRIDRALLGNHRQYDPWTWNTRSRSFVA